MIPIQFWRVRILKFRAPVDRLGHLKKLRFPLQLFPSSWPPNSNGASDMYVTRRHVHTPSHGTRKAATWGFPTPSRALPHILPYMHAAHLCSEFQIVK